MLKKSFAFTALALGLSLSGCSKCSEQPAPAAQPPAAPVEQAAPAAPAEAPAAGATENAPVQEAAPAAAEPAATPAH